MVTRMNKTFWMGLLLILNGCSSVPLTSMLKLSQLDPLTAEAEHIRIGVRLPNTVRVKPHGAVLTMNAVRKDTDATLQAEFLLTEEQNQALRDQLSSAVKTGFEISVFRIATADLDRLQALQQRIKAWKQRYPDKTQGSLSISVAGCRLDSLSPDNVRVSTYLKVDPEGEFIPLVRDVDLDQVAPAVFDSATLPICAT